jgi:TPR repeat protein
VVRLLKLAEAACMYGHTESCRGLARVYSFGGPSVTVDYNRATLFGRKGCDGDDGESCYLLAGTQGNEAQMRRLSEKSCDAGYVEGCFFLAELYALGHGGPQDLASAVAAYKKACESDHARACASLSEMYATGKGAPKNPQLARQARKRSESLKRNTDIVVVDR